MNENEKVDRRKFFGAGLAGIGAIGAGGVAGWFASRTPARAAERPALGPRFTYDVSDYIKTDPSLLLYDETAKIATGFTEPKCIEIAKDDTLFCGGDKAVKIFGKDGSLKSSFEVSELPHAIAIADDGKIFVGLKSFIEIHDASGKLISKSESFGEKIYVTSLALSSAALFVADAGNREIIRCDLTGKAISRFGKKNEDNPGFAIPSAYFDLSLGSDGLLWTTNTGRHQIEAYSTDGKFELGWGATGMAIENFCGCCNPVHFTRLPDGRFVTSEKGLNRIKIYDAHGKFAGVVAGADALVKDLELARRACKNCQIGFGFDVACDSQSRVFALDPATRDIRIFAPKQKAVAT